MNITQTKAYWNPLFERSKGAKNIELSSLASYSKNWFEITKVFGQSAPGFLKAIVTRLKSSSDEKETKCLEKTLQGAAIIALDDLGCNRGSEHSGEAGTIHYRMFEKMCAPISGLFTGSIEVTTASLSKEIENLFDGEVVHGLAVFAVVEAIAFNIVDSQLHLFKNVENRVFDDKDLTYIEMHREIEGEHAKESTSIAEEYLSVFPGDRQVFEDSCRRLCSLFEDFFTAMEKVVF